MSADVVTAKNNKSNIIAFLIETLGPYSESDNKRWTSETTMQTVGIDSFDFVEILFKVEDQYGIDIDYNANLNFTALQTIGDLAGHIGTFLDRKIAA